MSKRINAINSVIGEGSTFNGVMRVSGSLQIDGKFEGDVDTKEHLIIGPSGKVKTCIKANNVTIAGTLIGDIIAKDEVILLETGRVLGNIDSPKINVNDGVVVQGTMNISGGQQKDITKVIQESFSTTTANKK